MRKLISKDQYCYSYLNGSVSILKGNVDGEMGIHGAHLVAESEGNSLDHVLDVGADSADSGELLADSKPLADAEGVLSNALHLHVQVTEVLADGSAWSGDVDDAVLDGERHSLWEHNGVVGLDQLHDLPGLPTKRQSDISKTNQERKSTKHAKLWKKQ